MLCSLLKVGDWLGYYFCFYYFLSPVEKNVGIRYKETKTCFQELVMDNRVLT